MYLTLSVDDITAFSAYVVETALKNATCDVCRSSYKGVVIFLKFILDSVVMFCCHCFVALALNHPLQWA